MDDASKYIIPKHRRLVHNGRGQSCTANAPGRSGFILNATCFIAAIIVYMLLVFGAGLGDLVQGAIDVSAPFWSSRDCGECSVSESVLGEFSHDNFSMAFYEVPRISLPTLAVSSSSLPPPDRPALRARGNVIVNGDASKHVRFGDVTGVELDGRACVCSSVCSATL